MRSFWDGNLFVGVAILLGACAATGEDAAADGVNGAGSTPGDGASGSGSPGLSGGNSAGGNSSADTGNAGSSTGSGGICGSEEVPSNVETVFVPGNVLVVFDRSKSMNEDFDTPLGVKPKYQAAGEALLSAISPIAAELTIGAILFPSSSAVLPCTAIVDSIWSSSQLNFMAGSAFTQAWDQYWLVNKLILGTPLNRAFDKADEALQQSGLVGKTVVVVFGDGEPLCADGVPAAQRAAQWLAQGIETYVVGLSGAAGSALLNDIAAKGGTGALLLPTSYQQLEQELAAIATTTVTAVINDCVMTLDPTPPNPDDVHLIVTDSSTGQEFEVPRDPGNGEGWALSADGKTAEILGQVCTDAKSGRFSDVRFEYGCVDIPPLN